MATSLSLTVIPYIYHVYTHALHFLNRHGHLYTHTSSRFVQELRDEGVAFYDFQPLVDDPLLLPERRLIELAQVVLAGLFVGRKRSRTEVKLRWMQL